MDALLQDFIDKKIELKESRKRRAESKKALMATEEYEQYENDKNRVKMQCVKFRKLCRTIDAEWPKDVDSLPWNGQFVSLKLSDAITLHKRFIEAFTDDDNLARVKRAFYEQNRRVTPIMKRSVRAKRGSRAPRKVRETPASSSEDDE